MENWLASGQEIDGVASNNDEMALGALQAIKAAGKLGKIPVGGTDASHDALESMDKGELNNTVFQDPVGQGEEGVNAAYLMVKKETQSKSRGRYYLDSLPENHQGELQVLYEISPRATLSFA
jgi:inositol transport system substrate-binding protein